MKKVIGGKFAYQALLSGVVVAVIAGLVFNQSDHQVEAEQLVPSSQTRVNVVKSNSFTYPVAGVVEPTQSITVRAKQSGVIDFVSVTEGDAVVKGELLSRSMSPVLSARLAVAGAGSTVQVLGEQSALATKRAASATAALYQYEAIGLSTLTKEGNVASLETARAEALARLAGAETFYSSLFAFVDDTASFFPAAALKEYEAILIDWYGETPDYVRVGLSSPSKTISLKNEVANVGVTADDAILVQLLEQLSSINREMYSLFTLAEPEFLDEKKLSRTDTRFISYQMFRGDIAREGSAIVATRSGLIQAIAIGGSSDLSVERGLGEAAVNAELATLQASLGDELYRAVLNLGEAERAVVLAEIGEGENRAPFAAYVDEVLVKEGEYVSVGQPLMTLVGNGGRELMVKIPVAMQSFVSVGTPFSVAGEVVGQVDRIAPAVHGGAVSVYVTLTSPLAFGETVQGELTVSPEQDTGLYPINRHALFFGVAGPYLKNSEGASLPVTIVYDAGDTLVVKSAVPLPSTLMPAVGVRL